MIHSNALSAGLFWLHMHLNPNRCLRVVNDYVFEPLAHVWCGVRLIYSLYARSDLLLALCY